MAFRMFPYFEGLFLPSGLLQKEESFPCEKEGPFLDLFNHLLPVKI